MKFIVEKEIKRDVYIEQHGHYVDEPGLADGDAPTALVRAVNLNGDYVGDLAFAEMLSGKGIVPELRRQDHNVCSIGFCETEQKWYGWSHRAIYGFGVGSSITKGDCAYVPVDEEDARDDAVRFWSGPNRVDVAASPAKRDDHGVYFKVSWTYDDATPNERIRGTVGSSTFYAPEEYGKGEWMAKSLADARQMAGDFAEGVS